MAARTPPPVSSALHQLGQNVSIWRKLQRLTAAVLASRADISVQTLRKIERGEGGVSTENLLRVLRALGVMDRVVDASDPYTTDLGKLRADEELPQRVRI